MANWCLVRPAAFVLACDVGCRVNIPRPPLSAYVGAKCILRTGSMDVPYVNTAIDRLCKMGWKKNRPSDVGLFDRVITQVVIRNN